VEIEKLDAITASPIALATFYEKAVKVNDYTVEINL
jgi:hypothetical protein